VLVTLASALAALVEGEADVERMRTEYDRRRRLLVDELNALGLETFEPRGAFYAFPDIRPTGLDSETFSQRLLDEQEVAVVPGDAFGAAGAGFVRLSYAASTAKLETALERIRTQDVAEISIGTGFENERAKHLYRSLGFTEETLWLEQHL